VIRYCCRRWLIIIIRKVILDLVRESHLSPSTTSTVDIRIETAFARESDALVFPWRLIFHSIRLKDNKRGNHQTLSPSWAQQQGASFLFSDEMQ
jgi:hypothetical protein